MCKIKGFTLIELLVVIAIIALLMAILMPALNRVKKQARAVACQSNLHQWALIFAMYTGDNNGYFLQGWKPGTEQNTGQVWMRVLEPYYRGRDICCCPMATKPVSEGGWGAFSAWGIFSAVSDDPYSGQPEGYYGSYGTNGRMYNTPPELEKFQGRLTKDNWRTVNVRGADDIPVFLGSWWWIGFPLLVDEPPEYDWQRESSTSNNMRRFCINRHSGTVNGLFADWTVRKVGLKELWTLKWHRNCDTAGPWTRAGFVRPSDWPNWMRNFKDY